MASADLRDELLCSICLNTFTDPITLRCGHNFCRVCIDQVLNTQEGYGVFFCPECRGQFRGRPALKRNITLCNIVRKFPSTQPHQEEVTGICCTYCIHSPVPAVKSCLHCEASLCDNHLKVHSKSAEHVLTEPSTSMENRKCSVHKKILEYYCTEDSACICVSCSLAGEHRGHRVEILYEASQKKKEKLRNDLQKLITKREQTKERVQCMEEHSRKAQEKAAGEEKRVRALFKDIRRRLDELEKKVLRDISKQEEKVSLSLSDMIQKLEIKKDELTRKMRHIEEMFNMTDPLTFLQESGTGDLRDPEKEGDDEDTEGDDEDTEGDDEDTGGHNGGDQGVELISHISHTLSDIIGDVNVAFYMQDPADILLDVNTAANNVLISDNLKTATQTELDQNRPDTAERFQDYQVMSSSSISSGRHYWDVEIRRSPWWKVGVCYPSMDRRGKPSYIGSNNKSWCLQGGLLTNNQYSVKHDSNVFWLPYNVSVTRVRIYVDYEAGQLSFYDLSDPIRHLHTFTATFTEPLHAAFCVYLGCIKISGGAAADRNHYHIRNLLRDW